MTAKSEPQGTMRLLVDFGPLVVFFVTYKLAGAGLHAVLTATVAFMVAVVISTVAALITFRKVTPMLWLSTVLIVSFGLITLWLRDPKFIQMKPTIYYVLLAALLFAGLLRRKPLLRWLFGPVFPGLTEQGWLKLSRNWCLFFIALAIANEILRATVDFDTWLTIKVWGVTLVSFLFAIANMPMLLRHGLDPEKKDAALSETRVE